MLSTQQVCIAPNAVFDAIQGCTCYSSFPSCFTHNGQLSCAAAVLGALPVEDAARQIQKIIASSSQLTKLVSGYTSKTAPTDENKVKAANEPC